MAGFEGMVYVEVINSCIRINFVSFDNVNFVYFLHFQVHVTALDSTLSLSFTYLKILEAHVQTLTYFLQTLFQLPSTD